jgi:membrane protein involved in colicin uptake
MEEVIKRLRKDKLTSEEFKYVSDLYNYEIFLARKDQDHKKNMARQKKRLEKIALDNQLEMMKKAEQEKLAAIEQEKQKAEQEKQKAEQEKQKAELLQIKLAKMLLLQGETTAIIAETLEISLKEALELIERIEKKEV